MRELWLVVVGLVVKTLNIDFSLINFITLCNFGLVIIDMHD